VYVQIGLFAIHNVHEVISTTDGSRTAGPIVATNVYARTTDGWRMIVHHASPAPALPERAQDAPKTLH
jgi:ketosteroid isomerase-like protein